LLRLDAAFRSEDRIDTRSTCQTGLPARLASLWRRLQRRFRCVNYSLGDSEIRTTGGGSESRSDLVSGCGSGARQCERPCADADVSRPGTARSVAPAAGPAIVTRPALATGHIRAGDRVRGRRSALRCRFGQRDDAGQRPADGGERSGWATVDVLIDGVSAGAETLRVQNGTVRVGRRVTLSGGQGMHQAVFVVNEGARSAAQAFSHQCASLTRTRAPDPGQLTLPNLAFGDILYAEVMPGPAPSSREGSGSRVSLGDRRRQFLNPVIARDILTLTDRIQLPQNDVCPQPQDAYVTVDLAIAVRASRIADPRPYFSALEGPSLPGTAGLQSAAVPSTSN